MYNYNNWNQNQQWPSSSGMGNSGYGMQGQQMNQGMFQGQLGGQGLRPGVIDSQAPMVNQLQMYQNQFQQQALLQQTNPNMMMYNQQAMNPFAQQQYLQQQSQQQPQNQFLQQQTQSGFQRPFNTSQTGNQGVTWTLPGQQQKPPLPPDPPAPPANKPPSIDDFRSNFGNNKPPLPPEPQRESKPMGGNDFKNSFENRQQPPPPPPPPAPKPVTAVNLDVTKNPGIEDTVKKLLPFINDIFSKVGASHDTGLIPGLGELPNPKETQEEVKKPQPQPPETKTADSWKTVKQNQNSASSKAASEKSPNLPAPPTNPVVDKGTESTKKDPNVEISPSKLPTTDSPNKNKPEAPEPKEKIAEVEAVKDVKKSNDTDMREANKIGEKPLEAEQTGKPSESTITESQTPTPLTKGNEGTAPAISESINNSRPSAVPNSNSANASQVYDLKTLQDFDKKFKDWEKQFDDWKIGNKNHKDQGAYKRYVDQWSHWRQQLLGQRKFILDQIEKEKAAKRAEEARKADEARKAEEDRKAAEARKAQEAQEARELQEAENRRLAMLTTSGKLLPNSFTPSKPIQKPSNDDRSSKVSPLLPLPNSGNERMPKVGETEGPSIQSNPIAAAAKINLLEPFSKFQFQQEQTKAPGGKNPFDVGNGNPFDPNPFELSANPFSLNNQGLRSNNVFDQQQFGKVGFTNFGGPSDSLDSLFPNKVANLQQPTRIARVNLFDSGSEDRSTKFPPSSNAVISSEKEDRRWKVSDSSVKTRFGNQDRDAPPPKIPNRNEENVFERGSSNPFEVQGGSNSDSGWNSNVNNPWNTEPPPQAQQTRKNPFEVSPLPTFAQFLKEQQQKSGQPFDVSESFQTGRTNENSFKLADKSVSVLPQTSRDRSYDGPNQDFERLFRRDRNVPIEPERILRTNPAKEYLGAENFEEEVIDYGHGTSNDVPDDDMLKYVRREEEPAFDENFVEDDDDDRLKDSVTIDYGHGAVNTFPGFLSTEVEEVPPHPRDYYDAPYSNPSIEREALFGRRDDPQMGFYRGRGQFPGEQEEFFRGRGPPPGEEGEFYRGRVRREFEDMDGPRYPSGPNDFDFRPEGSLHGRPRGPRFAPPPREGLPDLRDEIRETEGKDGRRRQLSETPGVKVAPPREDEDLRIRDKGRERNLDARERDRERERERSKDRDRDRDRERDRDRRKDRDREDREREREREKSKSKGKDNLRDKDRESEWKLSRGHDGSPRRGDLDPSDSRRGRNANVRRFGRSRSRSPVIDNLVNPPPPLKTQLAPNARPLHQEPRMQTVLIEDILSVTGRKRRPSHILIILRGLPGSGKSHVAKLIKDREVELGGSAPRILSIDDYFMTEEVEKIVKDPVTGKEVKEKSMQYEYEPIAEPSYRQDLIKTLKKTIENGYFPFIIVDSVNDQLKYFDEMVRFATAKRFQVYIAEMEESVEDCVKRNIHDRRRDEIVSLSRGWQKVPNTYVRLDIKTLLQDEAVQDVEMEDVCTVVSSLDDPKDAPPSEPVVKSIAAQEAEVVDLEEEEEAAYEHTPSKWETIDHSEEKLNKLDGLKRKRKSSEEHVDQVTSVESWLHRNLPDDYVERKVQNGLKRVRWADIEERREQERMRDIGFVVGHTDWNRMTDPTFGSSALTKTKFI